MRWEGSLNGPDTYQSALIPYHQIAIDKLLCSPVPGRAVQELHLFRLTCTDFTIGS
jgi:hypothetical protein